MRVAVYRLPPKLRIIYIATVTVGELELSNRMVMC